MKFPDALREMKLRRQTKFSLVGEEGYLKEHFINNVRSTYFESEWSVFYPGEEQDALSMLYSGNFFAARVVVLRHFNKMKAVDQFLDHIRNWDDVLILVFKEPLGTSRAVTTVLSDTCRVDCPKLYRPGVLRWIANVVASKRYVLEEGAADLLIQRAGLDLFALHNELSKLFILKEESKSILVSDIRGLVGQRALGTSYDVFDALMAQDIPKAVVSFDQYCRGGNNVTEIISFMGSYLEKMYKVVMLRQAGSRVQEISESVGISKYYLSTKYLMNALRLGESGIAAMYRDVCSLSVKTRLFKGDPRILFERFILTFAG